MALLSCRNDAQSIDNLSSLPYTASKPQVIHKGVDVRNIVVVALSLFILLLLCPACTEGDADDIIRRFIPSCALREPDPVVEVVVRAWVLVSKTEYDKYGKSRSRWVEDADVVLEYFHNETSFIRHVITDWGSASPKDVVYTLKNGDVITVSAHVEASEKTILGRTYTGIHISDTVREELSWRQAREEAEKGKVYRMIWRPTFSLSLREEQ